MSSIKIFSKRSFGTIKHIIDIEDFNLYQTCKVVYIKQGRRKRKAYSLKYREYFHRILMNCPKEMEIDHTNFDTLDNRKSNLKICTPKQNRQKRPAKKTSKSTSKYKGVNLDTHAVRNNYKKQWKAQIQVDYLSINLGRYFTEVEAAKAYDLAAVKYFADFADVNFKEDINK